MYKSVDSLDSDFFDVHQTFHKMDICETDIWNFSWQWHKNNRQHYTLLCLTTYTALLWLYLGVLSLRTEVSQCVWVIYYSELDQEKFRLLIILPDVFIDN